MRRMQWITVSGEDCLGLSMVQVFVITMHGDWWCIHLIVSGNCVTWMGEGRVSWVQPRLPSQENRCPALTNNGVLPYLFLHCLTQNDQIWCGKCTQEGGLFYGVINTPPQGSRAPALPNFEGSLLFMHTPFVLSPKWPILCRVGR